MIYQVRRFSKDDDLSMLMNQKAKEDKVIKKIKNELKFLIKDDSYTIQIDSDNNGNYNNVEKDIMCLKSILKKYTINNQIELVKKHFPDSLRPTQFKGYTKFTGIDILNNNQDKTYLFEFSGYFSISFKVKNNFPEITGYDMYD